MIQACSEHCRGLRSTAYITTALAGFSTEPTAAKSRETIWGNVSRWF